MPPTSPILWNCSAPWLRVDRTGHFGPSRDAQESKLDSDRGSRCADRQNAAPELHRFHLCRGASLTRCSQASTDRGGGSTRAVAVRHIGRRSHRQQVIVRRRFRHRHVVAKPHFSVLVREQEIAIAAAAPKIFAYMSDLIEVQGDTRAGSGRPTLGHRPLSDMLVGIGDCQLWVVHRRPRTSAIRWLRLRVSFPALKSRARPAQAEPTLCNRTRRHTER